jgi:hypothetical protein
MSEDRKCGNCHFYCPDHQTCGCGDSVHRAEFVHADARCPCHVLATKES